jgi:C4-dicarboxylate-specific signal transduction histidine kinase
LRFTISPLEITRDRVLCSAVEITGSRITDDEIQKTLDALEEQVRARTAHLERINEDLKAEILEYRRFENAFLEERKTRPDTYEGQE